ncbi:hypothetical protein T05_14467 [Trichinella murrelli]|uniref:Uncharacterized protein n=1 Tax=Trichinella murrelli TaxID=144512 RepID=A0A0V0UDT4_9BILA|nr:hypothetical protein T05_14467 [Trichinella murrelli]
MQTWHKLLFHAKNVHAATFGSFINRPRARLAILQRNIRPGRRPCWFLFFSEEVQKYHFQLFPPKKKEDSRPTTVGGYAGF